MLETKSAYEVLGLKEGASRDEIEKRYSLLTKKYRAESMQDPEGSAGTMDMEGINAAYRALVAQEIEAQKKEEALKNPRRPNAAYKLLGIDQEKASNFFYYYKFHILLAILGILAVIFVVRTFTDRVEPDLNFTVVGKFEFADAESFKVMVRKRMPEVKELGVDRIILTGDKTSDQDYTMQMKAAVVFTTGGLDVILLDRANFEKYAQLNAFAPLEGLVQKLGVDKSRYEDCTLKGKEQTEAHIYGIKVTDSKLLKDAGIKCPEMMIAMSNGAAHPEKAEKFLSLFLK